MPRIYRRRSLSSTSLAGAPRRPLPPPLLRATPSACRRRHYLLALFFQLHATARSTLVPLRSLVRRRHCLPLANIYPVDLLSADLLCDRRSASLHSSRRPLFRPSLHPHLRPVCPPPSQPPRHPNPLCSIAAAASPSCIPAAASPLLLPALLAASSVSGPFQSQRIYLFLQARCTFFFFTTFRFVRDFFLIAIFSFD